MHLECDVDNDEECFDLITAADSSDFNVQYYGDLRENITSGQVYKLDENVVSGIVEVGTHGEHHRTGPAIRQITRSYATFQSQLEKIVTEMKNIQEF